ncbi:MAG: dihydrolipoamide dehydrogenase, partial [Phycisphaerales bacterium]|nr:dihydrolipoamide dehydrogenase [Phycisphaerales bacterium]
MPAEITMPQLSDTMTEGTIVKWVKKEGDVLKAGDIVAEVETDKATMEMETFEAGTLAAILVPEGGKVPVGGAIALIAKSGEKAADVKKNAGAKSASLASSPAAIPSPEAKAQATAAAVPAPATAQKAQPLAAKPDAPTRVPPAVASGTYNYDLIVIGGGPAGYAAAIRAGQLKKRVLCVEKENLGGTCLNWGCIPTKALLESGALVRKLRDEKEKWAISFDNFKVDFPKTIGRSRDIAGKLSKGIAHLFNKYTVKHELATATVVGPHKVKFGDKEVTGANILVCTGARARDLPNIKFDGKKIISSREAMTLPTQPKKLAIIGAGAIGCEFADFYSSMGTEVTIIEMLDHLLPIEDEDCSILLERSFGKRGIKVLTKTKTEAVDTKGDGVKLTLTTPKGTETVEADLVLLAVGVTGNVEGIFGKDAPVELFKGHIKVEPNVYATNVEGIFAAGDVIGPPWLAHVAHHEAVYAVEKIFGVSDHDINYKMIPGCTYTHPQVA